MSKNRKDQLERVMDEARLYSLLLMLPFEFIYKGSEHTTASKAATAKLFRKGYPEEHINRKMPRRRDPEARSLTCNTDVHRKLAQNILIPGLENIRPHTPRPSMTRLPSLLKHVQQHAMVPRGQLEDITQRYPFLLQTGLQTRHPVSYRQLTQLAEVRAAAEPLGLGPFSEVYFDIMKQIRCGAWRLSLLPWPVSMSEDLKREILRGLRSTDIACFDSINRPFLHLHDYVVIRAKRQNVSKMYSASMEDNVCTLYPVFFSHMLVNSITNKKITPGVTTVLELTQTRPVTIAHEMHHSPSLVCAVDQEITFDEVQASPIPTPAYEDPPRVPGQSKTCYGPTKCMQLVHLDNENGTTRAENNAENWAIHENIEVLSATCPGLDFTSSPIVTERNELAHHFSGFAPLCPQGVTPVHLDRRYDIMKDRWVELFGSYKPTSIKEVSEAMTVLIDALGEDGALRYDKNEVFACNVREKIRQWLKVDSEEYQAGRPRY